MSCPYNTTLSSSSLEPATALPVWPLVGNAQRIVGGSLATISDYPNMVVLLWSPTGSNHRHDCGGAIIKKSAVLTASHCLYGDSAVNWLIRAGSSFAHSGGSVHRASELIVHEHYNDRTIDNDVAVIRIVDTFNYNRVIQPAKFADSEYALGDNEVVWATGWGRLWPNGPVSEQLRQVQIWIVNQEECKQRYARLGYTVTDNMLCSGYLDVGGRDQCQGDSGGPLYHNGVIVGVSSWGESCALALYPGVNTRISRYSSWIESKA
ncbi:hypothetical protein ACJJTC_012763 [Scirpophaga incertulas]